MTWFLLLFSYFLTTLLVHSIICHTIRAGTVFTKFLVVGSVFACMLLKHFYNLFGFSIEFISGALSFAFACELYIFLFTFIASSISISIMFRLAKKSYTVDELRVDYNGKIMIANRLRRLREIGLMKSHDDQLTLTSKGAKLIQRFTSMQKAFRLDQS